LEKIDIPRKITGNTLHSWPDPEKYLSLGWSVALKIISLLDFNL